MSILIDEKTPILVQGITSEKASFHTKEMIAAGSKVVAGVTPGKGGQVHNGVPVFNTVKEAVRETGATTSLAFVAPAYAADAIMEAADGGIRLVCSITDGIPAQDMMRVKRYLMRYPKERRTMLVGPNCAGIISPGKAMLGIMPSNIYIQGSVGIISRSGTLGYEAGSQIGYRRGGRRDGQGRKACASNVRKTRPTPVQSALSDSTKRVLASVLRSR